MSTKQSCWLQLHPALTKTVQNVVSQTEHNIASLVHFRKSLVQKRSPAWQKSAKYFLLIFVETGFQICLSCHLPATFLPALPIISAASLLTCLLHQFHLGILYACLSSFCVLSSCKHLKNICGLFYPFQAQFRQSYAVFNNTVKLYLCHEKAVQCLLQTLSETGSPQSVTYMYIPVYLGGPEGPQSNLCCTSAYVFSIYLWGMLLKDNF